MNGFDPPPGLNRVLNGPIPTGSDRAESLLDQLIERSKLANTIPDNRLLSILTRR